jgi:hypothetical protein
MAVRVIWDDPGKTLLRLEVIGNYEWVALVEARDRALETSPDAAPVGILLDMRRASPPPPNTLTELRRVFGRVVGTGRVKVMVGASPILMSMIRSVGWIYPQFSEECFFARSLEEAYTILEQQACQ